MATGMYPGKGQQLYLASSGNPREPVWLSMRTPDPVIPDNRVSLGIPANPGIATDLNILFASIPPDPFTIEYDIDPTFATAYIIQTITPNVTDKLYTWSTNSELSGFLRINNTGGVSINEAYAQQRTANFG